MDIKSILDKMISAIGIAWEFVKTPMGLICCVAIPLVLLLIFEIINLIHISRLEKSSKEDDNEPLYMKMGDDNHALTMLEEIVGSEDILERINHDYLFEQQDEELAIVTPQEKDVVPLTYTKPVAVQEDNAVDSLYATREFKIDHQELQPIQEKTFIADMNVADSNRFNIEGIDVSVLSNALNLNLSNKEENRDISITVTQDYTNVVVESKDFEVNFALLKEQIDQQQRVIIQKTAK